MGDTVKHRAAVVAEGRRQEREHLPFVLLARLGTRKRGPGKPGPSLWSDPVAEIERHGGTADRHNPRESQARGRKSIISPFPQLSFSPAPFSLLFLRFLSRRFTTLFALPAPGEKAQVRRKQRGGSTCAWTSRDEH